MVAKQMQKVPSGRRFGRKKVSIQTASRMKKLADGKTAYKVSIRPSHLDRKEDSALQTAVFKKTQQQLVAGIPVARYDATKRSICLEYPDGHIEYT